MPKKFKGGENSKAVQARERKAAAKAEQDAAKQKAVEDAYWEDNDKHVQRKQQRKVKYLQNTVDIVSGTGHCEKGNFQLVKVSLIMS